MVATTPFQRLVKPIEQAPHLERVQVYDFNEKKTDVNIASDLISGAWTGAYEQARPVFAHYLRTNPRTLENWEQGRAKPNAQAALLIHLVDCYPYTAA